MKVNSRKVNEGKNIHSQTQNYSIIKTVYSYPLLILLVIMSFFAGYLWFSLQALKQKPNIIAAAQGNNLPPQTKQDLNALPSVTDKDHIRGSKDADVVLVEYSDLECPFCKRFHPTMQQVMQEYGNKVAWVYRQYPLSFHQNAQKEAEASECVNELGGNDAFWSFIDKIFEKTTSNGTGFALDQLGPLAAEIGIDQSQFQQCLDSGRYAKHVQEDEAGGVKTGVQGTPGTIIVAKNGKKDFANGALPFDQIKQQIDALLK